MLSSLRWSQVSIPGFLTKFCQNNYINLSYTYLEGSSSNPFPHVCYPAHHVPLILMLILTKAHMKSIIALHINVLRRGHIYIFWWEKIWMFFCIYFYFLYLSMFIMYIFIDILVMIFFKIQKYLKQNQTKSNPKCLSSVIGKTMVQAKNQTWVWVLPLLLIIKQLGNF